jgi:hypothetical protein
MKVSIDIRIDKLIWLTVSCYSLDEILLKQQLFKKILSHLLINNSISLITIAPQSYSLAYDIIPYYARTINGNPFLINNIVKCDLALLEEIVSSEEFERTLLIIVKNQFDLSDLEVIDAIGLIKTTSNNLLHPTIFCEDDGDSLCLYNSAIELPALMSMAQSFTAKITISTLR